MTEKRFKVEKDVFDGYCIIDNNINRYYAYRKYDLERLCDSLNELNNENDELKHQVNCLQDRLDDLISIKEENEQLKQDNTSLMTLIENQSVIITELHSKLLEHQLKEPIVLTKEDLEVMGKAISYYTHGRLQE